MSCSVLLVSAWDSNVSGYVRFFPWKGSLRKGWSWVEDTMVLGRTQSTQMTWTWIANTLIFCWLLHEGLPILFQYLSWQVELHNEQYTMLPRSCSLNFFHMIILQCKIGEGGQKGYWAPEKLPGLVILSLFQILQNILILKYLILPKYINFNFTQNPESRAPLLVHTVFKDQRILTCCIYWPKDISPGEGVGKRGQSKDAGSIVMGRLLYSPSFRVFLKPVNSD